jgi:hypothetical protein
VRIRGTSVPPEGGMRKRGLATAMPSDGSPPRTSRSPVSDGRRRFAQIDDRNVGSQVSPR